MKREYTEIMARLIKAMDAPAPAWDMPWSDAGNCPNTARHIERAEKMLNKYYTRERITFVERPQNQSYYAPDSNTIVLPTISQFKSTGAYYATKAHETIHSTGEYTRCNRQTFNEFTTFKFGDTKYSKEELTAEVGACFLLSELGIDTARAERNAIAYLHNWLSNLNSNTNWIYRAGALASDAVDYIIDVVER